MGPPQSSPYDIYYTTSTSEIKLTWQNSEPNVTFNVMWDQGINTWISHSNTSSQGVTLSSLTTGNQYGISIAAVNSLGQGPSSTPLYIKAASNPS